MALVIVGLLAAATISAHAYVDGVRAKQILNDVKSIQTAYLIYADRYRSVPGDDPAAASRWSGAKSGNGDGKLNGRFNDLPPNESSSLVVDATQGESLNFWWHLRLAGLIQSSDASSNPASPPQHAYRGPYGLEEGVLGLSGPALCAAGLPGSAAAEIDIKIDDGFPSSGAVRAVRVGADGAAIEASQAYSEAGSDRYVLCVSVRGGAGAVSVASAVPADSAPDSSQPQSGTAAPNDGGSNEAGGSAAPSNRQNWFRRFWGWWGRFQG